MLLLYGIEGDLFGRIKGRGQHCLMSWDFTKAMQTSELSQKRLATLHDVPINTAGRELQ